MEVHRALFTGVMEEKGRLIWKTRHFVLDGEQLACYAAEGAAQPEGAFAVLAFTDVPDRGSTLWSTLWSPRTNRIDIYGATEEQLLSVAARSPEDKAGWLAALGAVAEARPLEQHPRFAHLATVADGARGAATTVVDGVADGARGAVADGAHGAVADGARGAAADQAAQPLPQPLPPGDGAYSDGSEGSEDSGGAEDYDDAEQAALREPARAAADWRAGKAAAVAARKAAAPPEVRAVLDDFDSVYDGDDEENKRISRVVAAWLVRSHAAAHDDPATKRLARLVLGVYKFATNMAWAEVWDAPYKAGLRRVLGALGAPLGAAYAAEGLRAALGALTLPAHALVAADEARCAAAGRPHKLRCDIAGVVPVPAASLFDGDPAARQWHERVFIHKLKMLAMALNERFHATMREVLGPHVVAGEGVMAQNKDGSWRLTPEKGVARMECKRVTDHAPESGCRPAFNIDVLRVLAVCKTADKVKKALQALGARFDGCGRVKNGFAMDDAKAAAGFHLRAMMGNFVLDFELTYAQLALDPAVAAMWRQYAELSEPEGGAPRERWRAEAAAALAALTGAELAAQPVRFVCEAQIVLRQTYAVRALMVRPLAVY
jgi:hypothetical protein